MPFDTAQTPTGKGLNASRDHALTADAALLMVAAPGQSVESIQVEMAKLKPSQRAAMRRQVRGPIQHLRVTPVGQSVKVSVLVDGFRHHVALGPRGMVLSREVF